MSKSLIVLARLKRYHSESHIQAAQKAEDEMSALQQESEAYVKQKTAIETSLGKALVSAELCSPDYVESCFQRMQLLTENKALADESIQQCADISMAQRQEALQTLSERNAMNRRVELQKQAKRSEISAVEQMFVDESHGARQLKDGEGRVL